MKDEPYTKATVDVGVGHRKMLDDLSAETRDAVEGAAVVLVPDEGFQDYAGPVFPAGTVDFFQFLREHAPSGTPVAIAAEDTEYKEVVLHSDIVRLATLFVEYAAAPVATSLLGAYLKDLLGNRLKRAEARAAIILHRKDGAAEQTIKISYEGPAENIEAALTAAVAKLPTMARETPPAALPSPAAERTAPKQLGTPKKRRRKR